MAFNRTNVSEDDFRKQLVKADVYGKEFSKLRRKINKITV